MAWAKNGTSNTLGSAADDIDITDLTAYKFNQFLCHIIPSGNYNQVVTYDNNGNTDYAHRQQVNGASDNTATSQARSNWNNGLTNDTVGFEVVNVINIDSEEKLEIGYYVYGNTAGAGTAPGRREWVAKVDTTTNTGQFTRIDMNNGSTGDYDTNSNLTALGTD